ncbi:hemerythrin HHE cation-binding protein [Romeria aff. gracilis LEGE 07310]|uniref:Hemerythrin HHE cation-binding protein n=1 Tax=Vasconcelosia minhoensis LEGE 07310 TaxID=915328 RepID=A0A8J7AMF2_9CYAN|nr:hemerythrin HHE cation-binding protein [Romeria gracilis]MBE9076966.1 hemerythrin HHE cation-binding protein [Romeria aff. gracilis LEGE 07310]
MASATQETRIDAIATKLADMQALQELLISNEQTLLQACRSDQKIADTFQEIIEDDRQNMGTIQSAISELGTTSQPQDNVQQMVNKVRQMMSGNELDLYEKVMQHEALTHSLVMTGLLVHKAAQTSGDILEKKIDEINKVNFKNRKHQEQLKSVILTLGTRELTGREPDDGVWGQAEDAVAALKGFFGGITD